MKAKNRKTGEVVDIISYSLLSAAERCPGQDYVSYIDSKGVEHYKESLNYYWDFEPITGGEATVADNCKNCKKTQPSHSCQDITALGRCALEKQGEQKSAFGIDILFGAKDSELIEAHYYIPEGFHAEIEGNNVVIKKGEQKLDDKVESKFKVGDWVVRKDGENFRNGSKFARITKIDKEQHWFDSGTWLEDKDIRLWTIQDAKDGDVLAFDNGNVLTFNVDNIFIFKELYSSTEFYSYSLIVNGMFLCVKSEGFYPATKEQCDLFSKNLKEAGIEWDSDNKKVIKDI